MKSEGLRMLELRRLRLLHELSLRGTLGAVAEALSYSPSTVSQQLALLEREAGVTLFAPEGRRVRLTDEGVRLAAHAAAALDADERVRADIAVSGSGHTTVRAAVLQTTVQSVLPAALTLLGERDPDLRLDVAQVPPEDGLVELAARRFDLAIAEQYPGHTREHRPGLARVVLGHDRIRLGVSTSGPDADARRLADVADRPWVLEPEGTAARSWAVQQCRAAGFEPQVRFEIADLTAHAELIAAGRAVGLLPGAMRPADLHAVRLVDLPKRPAREVFAAVREATGSRRPVRAVIEAFRDAYGAVEER